MIIQTLAFLSSQTPRKMFFMIQHKIFHHNDIRSILSWLLASLSIQFCFLLWFFTSTSVSVFHNSRESWKNIYLNCLCYFGWWHSKLFIDFKKSCEDFFYHFNGHDSVESWRRGQQKILKRNKTNRKRTCENVQKKMWTTWRKISEGKRQQPSKHNNDIF